jgi:hypothetical protein
MSVFTYWCLSVLRKRGYCGIFFVFFLEVFFIFLLRSHVMKQTQNRCLLHSQIRGAKMKITSAIHHSRYKQHSTPPFERKQKKRGYCGTKKPAP